MRLFFTDLTSLKFLSSTHQLNVHHAKLLVEGIPFILNDDGSYPLSINRFFRECPAMGVRSKHSIKSYALDILSWLIFLQTHENKTVWEAQKIDIISYHRNRRQGDITSRISPASWNRSIAALEKLYQWGVEEKYIDRVPFSYKEIWSKNQDRIINKNHFRERAARKHNMNFISLKNFSTFKNVGLSGYLPNGKIDPTWRGRHAVRNSLFAELLVTTGLRISEATNLLRLELPNSDRLDDATQKSIRYKIPSAIAKGNKYRYIQFPKRILTKIEHYISLEREIANFQFQSSSNWNKIHAPINIIQKNKKIYKIISTTEHSYLKLDQLTTSARSRLLLHDHNNPVDTPIIWLTEAGLPVSTANWEKIFQRANERCQHFNIDIHVTPHTLRHTYAIHMLSMLIREQIDFVFSPPSNTYKHGSAYSRILGDPLQKLQRLLGHSSITSTYIYLDSLQEAQELVDSASDNLANDFLIHS